MVGLGALGGAVTGTGATSTGIALANLVGPIGWRVVGCKPDDGKPNASKRGNKFNNYTWDCWKPIVRDKSTQPSSGMTLHCLAAHPNAQSMSLEQGRLLVGNAFGERFHLAPVSVEGTLAFHVSILLSAR